ncbi:MAG: hypothetical protein JXB62_06400 [Pirellulales bacterium]|nr:hypothetical protein [Pirellulales bacterium]
MSPHSHKNQPKPHCCPCCDHSERDIDEMTRRGFLGGAAFGAAALTGLSWSALAAGAGADVEAAPPRRALKVKPVFCYSIPQRAHQRSWRSWGGIQTPQDADAEVARIQTELNQLKATADFPVTMMPIARAQSANDLQAAKDLADADVLLVYAANGGGAVNALAKLGKDVIFFVRHKSGPVYLWYEIISPRFLRQHTDTLAVEGIDFEDVVVDDQKEILWRLRALCGLRNTLGSRILAIGGPGAWAQPPGVVPDLVRKKWKFDIQTITYDELGKLLKAAREDQATVALARRRAEDYLTLPGTKLEVKREFVDNAFVLEQVFRKLMAKAECGAITINGCMGTIMPISDTTACLPLSTLNDDGYLAFCESDFVVIPSGMLLSNISGRPPFLNDPTYPHDHVITLAHCTGPRKMDGKNLEPVRILTHFESDYGAAPKVEMHSGQTVTNIVPDFKAERWLGFSGEIIDAPFLPICRAQIDIRFDCDTDAVAERMPGFHWMTIYGNYLREAGYALKRIPIEFENLG